MKHAGQIVLTPFPYSDLSGAKFRPVLMLLMLRQASRFEDWLGSHMVLHKLDLCAYHSHKEVPHETHAKQSSAQARRQSHAQ